MHEPWSHDFKCKLKHWRFQHEWKHKDGRPMSREDLMDVLFHVEYILIKASHGSVMRHSRYTLKSSSSSTYEEELAIWKLFWRVCVNVFDVQDLWDHFGGGWGGDAITGQWNRPPDWEMWLSSGIRRPLLWGNVFCAQYLTCKSRTVMIKTCKMSQM